MLVDKIAATDPHTVVIHLKFATSAFLPTLADPYNWIYQKKILDQDPHWYEHSIMGSGPFVFEEFQTGRIVKLTSVEQKEHQAEYAITLRRPHCSIDLPPRRGRSGASSVRRDGVED